MKKKPLVPLLKRRYTALTKEEAALRKSLKRLYRGNSARVSAIVAALYSDCTEAGVVSYSRLFAKISPRLAEELRRKTARMRAEFPNSDRDFPFAVAKFDSLNRLNAAKAELVLNELETARDMQGLIEAHLSCHVMLTMAATIGYLAITNRQITETEVEKASKNELYPIPETLYNQHRTMGDREGVMLQQAMTRGEDKEKAAQMLTEYSERRAQSGADRLLYTEGTRSTVAAVETIVRDYAQYFYSVTVGDEDTCETCLAIAAEQAARPVPIEQYEPWVTAPPYHTWCRCGIEVVWRDNLPSD